MKSKCLIDFFPCRKYKAAEQQLWSASEKQSLSSQAHYLHQGSFRKAQQTPDKFSCQADSAGSSKKLNRKEKADHRGRHVECNSRRCDDGASLLSLVATLWID